MFLCSILTGRILQFFFLETCKKFVTYNPNPINIFNALLCGFFPNLPHCAPNFKVIMKTKKEEVLLQQIRRVEKNR